MIHEGQIQQRLKWRHQKAKCVRLLGASAIYTIVFLFATLLVSIVLRAWPIFWLTEVAMEIPVPQAHERPAPRQGSAFWDALIDTAFIQEPVAAKKVLSLSAWKSLKAQLPIDFQGISPRLKVWLPLNYAAVNNPYPNVQKWLGSKGATGHLRTTFNWGFFFNSDSLAPESAGILGALMGTFLVVTLAFSVAVPIGIIIALFLEEFCDQTTPLMRFITININNLAAVPSIIFGLLGLCVFMGYFSFIRSSALVGGLTLSLMMLPLIIVSSRLALAQVPKTLKEAALGLGASKHQAVFKVVLPTAVPGIVTGVLLALARIIGESAPLIMVGMVVFIAKSPRLMDGPATVLPLQIYQWFQRPEPGFVEASSGAIVILLIVLLGINSIALFVRKKFEKYSV